MDSEPNQNDIDPPVFINVIYDLHVKDVVGISVHQTIAERDRKFNRLKSSKSLLARDYLPETNLSLPIYARYANVPNVNWQIRKISIVFFLILNIII